MLQEGESSEPLLGKRGFLGKSHGPEDRMLECRPQLFDPHFVSVKPQLPHLKMGGKTLISTLKDVCEDPAEDDDNVWKTL